MIHPNKKIMEELIEYARRYALRYEHYTAAFIIKNGKILAKAVTTVEFEKDPTAHAELKVIRKACKKVKNYHLENCYLYTTQEPCPMCASAIVWSRIKGVIYGFEGRYMWGRLKIKPEAIFKAGPEKIIVYPRFLEQECLKLVKAQKKAQK